MKRINTKNTGRITRWSNKRVTAQNQRDGRFINIINIIVRGFVLFQLVLHTAACEEMEDYEAYMEMVEGAEDVEVGKVTQPLSRWEDMEDCEGCMETAQEAEDMEAGDATQSLSCCGYSGKYCKCGYWPTVKQFVLVNAETNKDIGVLEDGDSIDFDYFDYHGSSISIRADVRGHVGRVVFFLNDKRYHTDRYWPYYIAGNRGRDVFPWEVEPGEYTLTATPYSSRYWYGPSGRSKTIDIIIEEGTVVSDDAVFVVQHSGMALDIKNSSTEEGAMAVQYDTATDSQHWTIRKLQGDGDLYKIVNNNSSKCLAREDESSQNIVQKTCTPHDPTQKWKFVSLNNDVYQVENAQSGLCMSVENDSPSSDAPVILYTCDGGDSQKWEVPEFTPQTNQEFQES